jgi:prepilin signal peptidase PulO-like enzyme (type II secretory pathway)
MVFTCSVCGGPELECYLPNTKEAQLINLDLLTKETRLPWNHFRCFHCGTPIKNIKGVPALVRWLKLRSRNLEE